MNSVNKTLYIPLYGKALVSKKGVILSDKKAEEIWDKQDIKLKGKSKSKWLAYYMAMRSKVFDNWVKEKANENPNAVVLHLGAGLDSRVERLNLSNPWYDVDFPIVISERKKYYTETDSYKMIASDVTNLDFLSLVNDSGTAIVILEGVSMYIESEKISSLFTALKNKFENLFILVDCYTTLAAKLSKIKNPVKEVGVERVFGVKSASEYEISTITFEKELNITPIEMIYELKGLERVIFKRLYAGKISKKLYKLYDYKG